MYVSEISCPNRRGRPHGKRKDRVKENMCERGAATGEKLDQARRECVDGERWMFFCRAHGYPLEGRYPRELSVKAIDR